MKDFNLEELQECLVGNYLEDVNFYMECLGNVDSALNSFRLWLFKLVDFPYYAILHDEGNQSLQVISVITKAQGQIIIEKEEESMKDFIEDEDKNIPQWTKEKEIRLKKDLQVTLQKLFS